MARKIIISGGGTGGHIFPAVSIANEIKRREPDADILFVGAEGGMEMEVVPRYGFPIEGLWISGIYRQINLRNIRRNLLFPFKLLSSLQNAKGIIKRFQPEAVVGVGGFASGPVGRVAGNMGIPLFLCEQNAYPGLVNKWLADKATKILIGNEDAHKYFDRNKTIYTGNPIRSMTLPEKRAAKEALGFDPDKPLILSLGGSLGAKTLNDAWLKHYQKVMAADVQLFWQCGKIYIKELQPQVKEYPNLKLSAFIQDMATAYGAADLIVTRAGGSTISELIALSKPSIMVPSPNVAEDHQTKNARSLSDKDAAVLVKDVEAREVLADTALQVLLDTEQLAQLTKNIKEMEKHDAAKEIVDVIMSHLTTSTVIKSS
ncbi:MAG: undecaprenyldiphospho-muramoylpentapeptide beta-N-acetylglucosaminyltransferase [Bacteroidota bacterium]